MTESEETPGTRHQATAVDGRRAAALILHHARRDYDGVNEVISEPMSDVAEPAQAMIRLLLAVLELHEMVEPKLLTEAGLVEFTEYARKFAALPPEDRR